MSSQTVTQKINAAVTAIMEDLAASFDGKKEDAMRRNTSIALDRFAINWSLPNNPTLDVIASKHNMTRERARQIVSKVCDEVRKKELDTSALERIASSREYELVSGPALYGLAAALKELCNVHIENNENKRPHAIRNAEIEAAVISATNKLVQRNGAANVYLAHSMACEKIQGLTQKDVRQTLGALKDFEWLDEDLGWYIIKDESTQESRNRLKNLINKILACSTSWVSVDEMYAQIGRQRRKDNASEEETPFANVPASVIKAILLRSKTYKHCGFDRFSINEQKISKSSAQEQFLSPTERQIYSSMSALNGVANRSEVKRLVVDNGGVNINSFTMAWETSPIIWPLEHSIHKVVGWKLDSKAFERAQENQRSM